MSKSKRSREKEKMIEEEKGGGEESKSRGYRSVNIIKLIDLNHFKK